MNISKIKRQIQKVRPACTMYHGQIWLAKNITKVDLIAALRWWNLSNCYCSKVIKLHFRNRRLFFNILVDAIFGEV